MAENEAPFRISSGTSASDSTRSSITAKPSTPTAASTEAASRNGMGMGVGVGAGAGVGTGTGPAHIDTDASTPHHHK